ncbi:uncharacterized protein LOC106164314 [Lingula anatina]|nr:uncharacterized protein LOC106164314 [Lingula anatina]|eukprot:XP_013397649.1 uncharacterized protein LOC106164314 [Lingula anatina]
MAVMWHTWRRYFKSERYSKSDREKTDMKWQDTDLYSSYEKAVGKLERRGSLPMVSRSLEDNMDATSGTFKLSSIQNFFSKKTLKGTLKRTKSATKLDRKRTAPGALDGSES